MKPLKSIASVLIFFTSLYEIWGHVFFLRIAFVYAFVLYTCSICFILELLV